MDELITLAAENLSHIPDNVRVPSYDRGTLKAGIVHIGLGNFHRAHQAWYLHRLFEAGLGRDWAIIGAGVRPSDAAQRQRLEAQDWLTTLIELDPSGKSAEIIGSMIDYMRVEEGNAALIAAMARPEIRIASLTVTEGGYYIDPADGSFDESHPDIVHDATHPERPRTAFGAMVEALRQRRDAGHGAFTGLSCDNLQGNGAILRQSVLGLAHLSDPGLASWIEAHATFPNSMVDCIVPATGPGELQLVREFGIDDAAPVTHENFRQWVIEDNFCAGRPPLEEVGVTFSDDVHAFETMKLRILNGGHQIIAIPGDLFGIETISGAMAHPLIAGFLNAVIRHEVVPHVESVPSMEPADYLDLIERRFANGQVKDTTRRVAFDGSSRQPGFLFPSIRDCLKRNVSFGGLSLATALWCRYCEGVREDGSVIDANDPCWSDLQKAALAARHDPLVWINQRGFYGDLADDPRFVHSFAAWYRMVVGKGVEAALSAYLEETPARAFAS